MYNFTQGLVLNREFYEQVIKGFMAEHFPELSYSAALIGFGSDVMGYDTPTSMDHMWGPRLYLFLNKKDEEEQGKVIEKKLSEHLPLNFKGFPTNYSNPDKEGISTMEWTDKYPVRHLIWATSLECFVSRSLGCNYSEVFSLRQWLGMLDQSLIELTAGEVYYDGLGTLKPLRERLSFFPMEVARVRLAALWTAVAQEVAFVGRNRDMADFLSVKMLSARLVNVLMKMCFYIEKSYIPYSKWLGNGFRDLACYNHMMPKFKEVLESNRMEEVESKLAEAYLAVVDILNETDYLKWPIDISITDYYNRPYKVIFTEPIIDGLMADVPESLKSVKLDDLAALLTANGIDISNLGGWIRSKK